MTLDKVQAAVKELETGNRTLEIKFKAEFDAYNQQVNALKQRLTKYETDSSMYSHKLDSYTKAVSRQHELFQDNVDKLEASFIET